MYHIFLIYDLRDAKNNPFPEKNVDMFYCSHTLEHAPSNSIDMIIKRLYESLKPGGVLRIIVPDADLVLNAYDNNDYEFFLPYKSWFEKREDGRDVLIEDYLVQLIATPKCRFYKEQIRHHSQLTIEEIRKNRSVMERNEFLDYLVSGLNNNNNYGTDHLNWFDSEKLMDILTNAGFSEVYKSAFGQSKELIMRQVPIFDETLPYLSLFVEARK